MTEEEQRVLARRLADGSRFVDFDGALFLVRQRPAQAEELLRQREESERKQEELDQALLSLRAAARELR